MTDHNEHMDRTAKLCVAMGRYLNLNAAFIRILHYAGVMHDIGKEDVPKEILEKKGYLTSSEREIVQEHVRNGCDRISAMEYETVVRVVAMHHEFTKNAYPRATNRRTKVRESEDRRQNSENIQRMGEILAICDLYDALSSERQYKPQFPKEKIQRIINDSFIGDKKLIPLIFKVAEG